MMTSNQQYSDHEKRNILQLFALNGAKASQIERKLRLVPGTLAQWQKDLENKSSIIPGDSRPEPTATNMDCQIP
ncbi:transposase [Chloroflexi bacterium TSY]|nr:transposase [Chloroflexi bacterium TSY]